MLFAQIVLILSFPIQVVDFDNTTLMTLAGYIFHKKILAYFITHPHLDHVAGWVLDSIVDASVNKTILGSETTISTLRQNLLNWRIWPSQDNIYNFTSLDSHEEYFIESLNLTVTMFQLSHGKMPNGDAYTSSGILIEHDENYVLYLGDTGADSIEGSNNLKDLWSSIAPLVDTRQLRGIFLECSFPNEVPDSQLYGHLNPRWFMSEMQVLQSFLIDPESIRDIQIIVTHIKPTDILYSPNKKSASESLIRAQLAELDTIGLSFVFPQHSNVILL